jgi:hypothetical protein
MRTLLLSTVVYLLGIAIVLYLKPDLMFDAQGRWREFGVGQTDKTSFPFWMFCLLWAVVSYMVGKLLFTDGQVDIIKTAATSSLLSAAPLTPTARAAPLEEEDIVEPLPVKVSKKSKKRAATAEASAPQEGMKPGYYRLNREATERNGVPRYIYIGPEAPAAETSDGED